MPNRVPAGKKQRLSRSQRQEQLLEHAENLFAHSGYQGTSIEEIAAAAGVTRPMVYNCFGNKDGIYLACLSRARARFEQQLLQAVAHAESPEQRLRAGINAYFCFVKNEGPAWDVLFGGGAAIAGPAEAKARSLRFDTVSRIALLLQNDVQQPLSNEQRQAYAHVVSGAAEQLAKWWRANPQLSQAQMVEAMMQVCWTGLGTLAHP